MAQIVRYCPDCDEARGFELHHYGPGECPDAPDGECSEWSCTDCGAALLVGVIWLGTKPAGTDAGDAAAELSVRVA